MKTEITSSVLCRRFPATDYGAHLARRRAVFHLTGCGHPPNGDTSTAVALIVSELAANAVRHGSASEDAADGGFRLRVTAGPAPCTVRVEVSDTLGGVLPWLTRCDDGEAESGRGLLLVDSVAARWGVTPHGPAGKTVWAEYDAPPP
ncbi:ATP-binding protein [Streptomyces sp. HB2AG]|uniref:ATP-binding protein n=1 Tax=Streptomyces sp. HB2AG TaxID=2983400 RepID=UPI0022AA8F33|nr:ATP-binding protein [Streptomyces sp. HB2AG]MCZ2524782.1 ATP-binding protein [Streptomyces sp. HB2AG]